jgi:hypothetical protein
LSGDKVINGCDIYGIVCLKMLYFVEKVAPCGKRRVAAQRFTLDGCQEIGGESLAEQEAIRGGTKYDGCTALIQKSRLPCGERESVDEDDTVVEDVQAVKIGDLIGALGIGAFCGVDDERRIERCGMVSRNKITIECEGVSPSEVTEDADRKSGCSESRMDSIVMANGGDT